MAVRSLAWVLPILMGGVVVEGGTSHRSSSPCEVVSAPRVGAQVPRVEVSVGGDLMPVDFRLVGHVKVVPEPGKHLPASLRADSAWFTAKGRTVGLALVPVVESHELSASLAPRTRLFGFSALFFSLGPGADKWLVSLDERPFYRGAIRVRLVWGSDSAYVDASQCPLEFLA